MGNEVIPIYFWNPILSCGDGLEGAGYALGGYITAGEKKTMRCRAWGAGGGKVQIAAHLWLGHTGREQRFRNGQSGTRRCAFVNKCLGEMNLWPRRESWFEVWAGS